MADDLALKAVELWNEAEHVTTNNNNNCRIRLSSKNIEALLDYLKFRYVNGRIYVSKILDFLQSEFSASKSLLRLFEALKKFQETF